MAGHYELSEQSWASIEILFLRRRRWGVPAAATGRC